MSFDIPRIVDLKPYLDINGEADINEVNQLNRNLLDLQNKVSGSTASILPSLTYQQDVKVILDREQARLNDRKSAIDAADKGQKRMVDLTKNATQRNRAMNKMYITVVVALIIYLAIHSHIHPVEKSHRGR